MNRDLEGLCEDTRMLGEFAGQDAAQRADRHAARKAAIVREGGRNGLAFTKPNPYRAGFLGDKPPSAMQLIDQRPSSTGGLGASYHRLLSGVTHGQTHGLARFLMPMQVAADPGTVTVQMDVDARSLPCTCSPGRCADRP